MRMKFYSFDQLKFAWLISISFLCFSQMAFSQNEEQLYAISRDEFVKMDAGHKSMLIHQWINASVQHQVPSSVEEKALSYCKANHIDERIYQKYKILLQIVTNETLPLSNRINACYFIIENYDASIFPVDVVGTILDELILKSK